MKKKSTFAILKAIFILLHLSETGLKYFRNQINSPRVIHLPLFDLFPLNETIFVQLLLIITGVSGLLALLRIKPSSMEYITVCAGFLFELCTLESRQTFSFFPTMMLLAVVISERLDDNKPILMFITSVYFFTGIHKIININQNPIAMQYIIKDALNYFNLSENLENVLVPTAHFLTGALEVLLAFLFMFRRTRKGAIFSAFFFHGVAASIFLKDKIYFVSLYFVLAIIMLEMFSTDSAPNQSVYKSNLFRIFAAVVMAWGLLPLFLNYSNTHVGWAAFSEGEQRNQQMCLNTNLVECREFYYLHPAIFIETDKNKNCQFKTYDYERLIYFQQKLSMKIENLKAKTEICKK